MYVKVLRMETRKPSAKKKEGNTVEKLKKELNRINYVVSWDMSRVEKGVVGIDEFEEIVAWLDEAVAGLKKSVKEYKDNRM